MIGSRKFLLATAAMFLSDSQAMAQCTYEGQTLPGGNGAFVNTGETACHTTINGGERHVYATATTISGGIQKFYNGAMVNGSNYINSGGTILIALDSSQTAPYPTTINTSGGVTTFNGGTLRLYSDLTSTTFKPTITGNGIIQMAAGQSLTLGASNNSGDFQLLITDIDTTLLRQQP